jgi:hypothetical protein
MIPTSLTELAICAVIVAAGGLLYLLGHVFMGHREGGRRAVLIGVASASGFLGSKMVRHLWDEFHTKQYPEALLFFVGCVFVIFATILIVVSVFASDQKVRKYFDGVLGGL